MRAHVIAAILVFGVGSASAQTAATTAPDDGFKMGSFTFKPGGRIKLDVIRDFDPIGSEDLFDARTIPVDGSEGANSNIHAKETRLSLDVRGPVEGKELRMYVETDFFGSASGSSNYLLRLRHAYGSYGGLLAGYTWSTFVDEANIPNTIDLESATAYPFIRQAQARWTQKLGAKVAWSAAVEDNKSSIALPSSIPGKAEYPMPDLVTRVRFDGSRGHAFVAAFLGLARFRPVNGEPDDETLWGTLVSGRIKTVGRDYAYGQVTIGEGVGRYRGGLTAVPDANGHEQAPALTGFMGGYEHFWSDQLSSNALYSRASSSEKDFYPPEANRQLDYASVNLLYWFLPDRALVGVEYLHGRREVFSGAAGTANRLQFAIRFHLPS